MNFSRYFCTTLLTCTLTLLLGIEAFAQSSIPQRFSWQGIARDESGSPLVDRGINVRISVINNSAFGNIVYVETHTTISNAFGLINLQIGGGVPSFGLFRDIDWTNGFKWLRVEIDPDGEGFVDLGTSQLLSVPYALASGTTGSLALSDLQDVSIENLSPGQILRWDGGKWVVDDVDGNVTVTSRLSGDGTSSSPLDIADQGATNGQVLKWDGSTWTPADDEGQSLNPGPGIGISGGNIFHTEHTGDVIGQTSLIVQGLQGRPVSGNFPVSGQVLKWNGSIWEPSTDLQASIRAGSGLELTNNVMKNIVWTFSGSNIYRTTGNVGLGTGTPSEQLHVKDNFRLDGAFMPNAKAGQAGQILTSDGANNPPVWENASDVFNSSTWLLKGNGDINPSTDFVGTTDANPLIFKTNGTERIRILSGGNTGFGTTTPSSAIDIEGDNAYAQLRLRSSYTPSSSTDANGNVGDIAWDENYIYVKTSGGWKRAALSTW